MSNRVLLVVPEAPAVEGASGAVQRRLSGEGLRVGVLDNSKGNADHLLRFVVEGMKSVLPVKSVVSLRKDSVSLPAPGGILDQLTREADVVVSAMAD
jgi:hypothetical protein